MGTDTKKNSQLQLVVLGKDDEHQRDKTTSHQHDENSSRSLSLIFQWKQQLITRDDPIQLHKILGALCLVSFLFRMAQMGQAANDMGFATHPDWTIPTIILHLLLNLSAFQFRLPKRRIAGGYRIWPEYRLHSLVFLVRSLAVIGLYYYEQIYQIEEPKYRWNLWIVILAMMAADLGSRLQGHYQSNSIRDLDIPPAVQFLFSAAQFLGTGNLVFGMRRYTMHMVFVMIVQVNAFLMTLRRKNLASQSVLVSVYGVLLLLAVSTCAYDYVTLGGLKVFYAVAVLDQLAMVQRMTPWPDSFLGRLVSNKYVVWTTYYILAKKLREEWLDQATLVQMQTLFLVSLAATLCLGWYKCFGAVMLPCHRKKFEEYAIPD